MSQDPAPVIDSSWSAIVDVSGDISLPESSHAYRLFGARFHGEFDIGVRTVDDGTGPYPIMPAEAYAAVSEYITDEVNVTRLRERTERHGQQEVGQCVLERVDDGTVRVKADLFRSWRDI